MEIICGKSEEVLKNYPDNYFTACVTDPPYGISFMNQKWDYDVPSVEFWELLLRKMKPGATLLCFAGARTQHRMASNVEDAGFLLKDTIEYLCEPDVQEFYETLNDEQRKVFLQLMGGPNRFWITGQGFPKGYDISKGIDKKLGKERKVVGKRKHPTLKDTDKLEEQANAAHGDNAWSREWNLTSPASEEAQLWDGYKSHQLKPAYEPILVAMKPNEGTYVDNALEHGVSGINIDDCRVPTTKEEHQQLNKGRKSNRTIRKGAVAKGYGMKPEGLKNTEQSSNGRYPANIMHDGSEEVVTLFPQTKSGLMKPSHKRTVGESKNGIYGKFDENYPIPETYGDEGSAARFFYCAKVSKKERNLGTEEGNTHPTVKPIALMEWLIKLVKMPSNNMIVDPFCGSGSTGCAGVKNDVEDMVLIDEKEENVIIAKQRVEYWSKQQKKLL